MLINDCCKSMILAAETYMDNIVAFTFPCGLRLLGAFTAPTTLGLCVAADGRRVVAHVRTSTVTNTLTFRVSRLVSGPWGTLFERIVIG